MEPSPILDALGDLPTWQEILRIWPLTLWAMATLGLGYWVGRRSRKEFIDFLKDRLSRARDE